MTFEQALRQQLEATPDRKRRGKKLLALLNSPKSKRRTRKIERLQRHAEAHIGREPGDWSDIDWASLFDTLLKLLLALLPFLI